jgi:hypothetical protein
MGSLSASQRSQSLSVENVLGQLKITSKMFANSSPGFLPWDKRRRLVITPKALTNTFGVIEIDKRRFPSVVASLQHWAKIGEHLRRKNLSETTNVGLDCTRK